MILHTHFLMKTCNFSTMVHNSEAYNTVWLPLL